MPDHLARIALKAQGRPATYTAPGGSASSVRAKVRESDELVSLGHHGTRAAQAQGAMLTADSPARGGLIDIDGAQYRIDGMIASSVPGLTELSLTRTAGKAHRAYDFSHAALSGPRSESIRIGARDLRAHVNRQGVVIEEDGLGNPVETVRTVFAVAQSELPAVYPGDRIEHAGATHTVRYTAEDGLGLIRMYC